MRSKLAMGLAFGAMVAALALAPPPAGADVIDTPLRKDFPKPSDNPALEQWRDGRTWRYSTDYLFGTTRGLKDYNIPRLLRARGVDRDRSLRHRKPSLHSPGRLVWRLTYFVRGAPWLGLRPHRID